MSADLEVLAPGPLATVQDLGRTGYLDIGVGMSGAADRASFRLANRLVGNEENAPAVEVTFGGFALRARRNLTVAVTGACCPISIDGREAATNTTLRLSAGSRLHLGTPPRGLRSYVAVRGGLDVEPVLGSRATDLLSGLGPDHLRPGSLLSVGTAAGALPAIDFAPVTGVPGGELRLRVTPGPRDDWFTPAALSNLFSAAYTVTSQSNRVGIRLEGPELPRSRTDELPSEGMVAGAIQVPPAQQPTLFLVDHPVTGGYPVIGVVMSADVDIAAQARPGQAVRFVRSRECGGSHGGH